MYIVPIIPRNNIFLRVIAAELHTNNFFTLMNETIHGVDLITDAVANAKFDGQIRGNSTLILYMPVIETKTHFLRKTTTEISGEV